MATRRQARWLLDELDDLVAQGVVAPAVAEDLRRHYRIDSASSSRLRETLLAILGASLIGGGIVLMLAYNWHELSRPLRTTLSFLPLIVAQALAGYALWRQQGSAAWREGSATLLTLAIAAAIALVGQTYHIPGDLETFLFTWMLLSLPGVYLLAASIPAMIVLVGLAAWVGNVSWRPPVEYWLLVAALLPHLLSLRRRADAQGRYQAVAWTLAVSTTVVLGASFSKLIPESWLPAYGLFLAVLFLDGRRLDADRPWRKAPLFAAGSLGIVGFTLLLTYESLWDGLRLDPRSSEPVAAWAVGLAILWAVVLTARLAWLLVWAYGERRALLLLFGLLPFLASAGYLFMLWQDQPIVPATLFNVYFFALGLAVLVTGLRGRRAAVANAGMTILSLWVVLRFFDSDVPLVFRGIAFLMIGAGFLGANRYLGRRRRGIPT